MPVLTIRLPISDEAAAILSTMKAEELLYVLGRICDDSDVYRDYNFVTHKTENTPCQCFWDELTFDISKENHEES